MKDIFSVKGKIVLITGSTQGLGLTFAKGFAAAGARVVLNGRDPEKLKRVVGEFRQEFGIAEGYAFDVADSESVKQSIERVEKEIGPIDVLVNNAGIQRRAPLEELSLEDWKTVIDVNLTAAFYVGQCAAKGMIQRKTGKIINITSLNAEMARPSIGNYSAAKGGLKMLTKSMATEWGKYNIQTNAIGPGYFATELTMKLVNDPEFDSWVKKEVPLGRWGDPEDLIGAAIFLASEASCYVNGHTLYVDGGWQASL